MPVRIPFAPNSFHRSTVTSVQRFGASRATSVAAQRTSLGPATTRRVFSFQAPSQGSYGVCVFALDHPCAPAIQVPEGNGWRTIETTGRSWFFVSNAFEMRQGERVDLRVFVAGDPSFAFRPTRFAVVWARLVGKS